MEAKSLLSLLAPWVPACGLLVIGALILASRVFRKNPFSIGFLISALLWVWLRSATDTIFWGTGKWMALYAQYVALAFLPPFWIGTCVSFTGQALRAARGILIALFATAVLFSLLIATSSATSLFFKSVVLSPTSGLFARVPTAAYYILMAYLFTSIGGGAAFIVRNTKGLSALDRRRAIIILIAVIVPAGAGFVDQLRAFPYNEISFASLAILFSVAVLVYGVVSSRLMSPIPLVHRTMVDEMAEPVLACDGKYRIIYANPAAHALSADGAIPPRVPLSAVFPEIVIPEDDGGLDGRIGVKIRHVEYHVSVKRVASPNSEEGTTVLALHDVTRIVAEKAQLEDLVAERTVLLGDAKRALETEIELYKTSQAELEKLVGEKDALLRELNHRVKNNLQVISSLLMLQGRKLGGNAEIRDVFNSIRSRIASISLVHERLYRSSFHEALDFGEYVAELAGSIGSLYSREGDRTTLEIHVEEFEESVDFCVDFGLVLNELMTNAYKHGIIPKNGGTIRVGLRSEPGVLILSVADTGPGFPDSKAEISGNSLGLIIIRSILPKYGASLNTENHGGAVAEIRIPRNE